MKAMRLAAPAVLFLVGVVIALTMALSLAAPAHAQTPQCAGLVDVLDGLDRNYGEGIAWQGSGWGDSVMIVTAKPDGTTWTILVVLEDQVCLVASGTGWSGIGHPAGEAI